MNRLGSPQGYGVVSKADPTASPAERRQPIKQTRLPTEPMDWLLPYLKGDPLLNLAFLALAFASIGVSFVLYWRSRKEKVPVFNIRHFILIRAKQIALPGLRITHDGHELADLTLTRFALWNRGRATVNRNDVAPIDPLRLQVPSECRIIHSAIEYTSTPANNFRICISQDRTRVDIEFDFFHTNEGCTLAVYHTASGRDLTLQGTIKGVRSIPRGVFEADNLLFPFLDKTLGRILPQRHLKWPHFLIMFAFLVVFMVPAMFLLIVGLGMRIARRAPDEYRLED